MAVCSFEEHTPVHNIPLKSPIFIVCGILNTDYQIEIIVRLGLDLYGISLGNVENTL